MDWSSVPVVLAVIAAILVVVFLVRGGDPFIGVSVLLIAIAVAVAAGTLA